MLEIAGKELHNTFHSNKNGTFLLNELFNDNYDHYVRQDVVMSGDFEESLINDLKNITNIYTICMNVERNLFINNYTKIGSNKIYFPNNDKDQLDYLDEYQDLKLGSLYDDDFMDQERLDYIEVLLHQEIVSYFYAKSSSIVGKAKKIYGSSHLLHNLESESIAYANKTKFLIAFVQQILSVSDAGYLFEKFFKKYQNEVNNVLEAGNLIASAFITVLLKSLSNTNPSATYYDWLKSTISDHSTRYCIALSHFDFLVELIPKLDAILHEKGYIDNN